MNFGLRQMMAPGRRISLGQRLKGLDRPSKEAVVACSRAPTSARTPGCTTAVRPTC